MISTVPHRTSLGVQDVYLEVYSVARGIKS